MSERPTSRRGMTLEERQPDYEDLSKCPKTLTKTRHIDDVLYVAGRAPIDGHTEYDIMFVTSSVEEEEATTAANSVFGMRITQPAEYLKGATGIIKDVALRAGVDIDKCYYTACCKWLLPRTQRAKPAKKIMKWGMPVLEDEIKRVKPKIIVCLGKHVFDMVSPQKISFDDAHGCWFWSEDYQAHLYVMYAPSLLIGKPEYYETFRVDFKEVARRKEILDNGGSITGRPFQFQVIRDMDALEDWLDHLETLVEEDRWPGHKDENGHPLLAVDCEWHGRTHMDGKLRTIQFAWSETDAVVIEFRDEKTEWSFEMGEEATKSRSDIDNGKLKLGKEFTVRMITMGSDTCAVCGEKECDHLRANRSGDAFAPDCFSHYDPAKFRAIIPKIEHIESWPSIDGVRAQCERDVTARRYKTIGKKLSATTEKIKARYIGHHYAADAPWMNHTLGMEIYQRCELDTEFAQQTVDESSELGLERGIAMKYTNLGRYDYDLMMWKRENKELCKGGYGFIPSKIIHPYGAADVITPYRAYPMIKRQLEAQRLWAYYRDIFNPFVTDVFTEFTMVGLPMDVDTMDDLRDLFTFTKDRLNKKLKQRIAKEATQKLKRKLMQEFGVMATKVLVPFIDDRNAEGMRHVVKVLLLDTGKLVDVPKWNKIIAHWEEAPAFNIRSPDQMARWLFDFEELIPIKSTNQKAKGLPSMAWEKVLELPADRQALFKPAVDKQTLAILSEQLPAIDELLNLNAVGNLSKAFLKEPDVYIDEDTGEEVTEEHGLHAWLASDGRVHGQMSATETGRPRSWAPNTLNWPSYVNKRVAISVATCVQEAFEEGDLPENLLKWVGATPDDLPSIRSCVKVPDGWVLVESDYATAEMVALAIISGDKDLMRILFDPDPEWAKLKHKKHGETVVRVAFSDPKLSGVPESARSNKFLMHVWRAGECIGPVDEDDLLRDKDGNIVHAKYDIHWSLVERTYGKYREMMKAKVDRNAAKVLNFCVAEGEKVLTRDRGAVAIESVTLDDLLWDGVEWVHHEGVVYTGRKEVVHYQGLWATREHEVWTVEKGKLHLGEAIEQSLELRRSAAPGDQAAAEVSAASDLSGDGRATRGGLLLRKDAVSDMWSRTLQGASEPGERVFLEVPVPGSEKTEQGSPGRRLSRVEAFSRALGRYEAAVRDRPAPALLPLLRAWHKAVVFVQETLHRLGSCNLAWVGVHGTRVRSKGQRWTLLPGELEAGDTEGKHGEPRVDVFERGYRSCASTSSADARDRLHGGRSAGLSSLREDPSGNTGAVDEEHTRRFAETCDILNAGPRHRFTCSGVLVSNSSAYGASSSSLERKIESDTGVKPEEGTGERGLEAIRERQPRATEFLEEMAKVPKERGMYRAASGRIRHCLSHSAGSGVGWRQRNSIDSALGREMRNFPPQESVGATSARACQWLLKAYRKLKMQARPLTCLYDSVVTICPLEERFLAAKLHQLCMSTLNVWRYNDERGDRVLQYTIDNEFNWRWSTRPDEEDQRKLDDRTWYAPDSKWTFLENHPNLPELAGLKRPQ